MATLKTSPVCVTPISNHLGQSLWLIRFVALTCALIFIHLIMTLLGSLLTISGKSQHYATVMPQGEVVYSGDLGHAVSCGVCLNDEGEVALSSCHPYRQSHALTHFQTPALLFVLPTLLPASSLCIILSPPRPCFPFCLPLCSM